MSPHLANRNVLFCFFSPIKIPPYFPFKLYRQIFIFLALTLNNTITVVCPIGHTYLEQNLRPRFTCKSVMWEVIPERPRKVKGRKPLSDATTYLFCYTLIVLLLWKILANETLIKGSWGYLLSARTVSLNWLSGIPPKPDLYSPSIDKGQYQGLVEKRLKGVWLTFIKEEVLLKLCTELRGRGQLRKGVVVAGGCSSEMFFRRLMTYWLP